MRKRQLHVAMALPVLLCALKGALLADELGDQARRLHQALKDKIVKLDFTLEYEALGRTHSLEGSASGIVVSPDGLVMFTGFALFRGAYGQLTPGGPQDIKVTFLDQREYQADYVGVDRKLNLAFVKLKTEADAKLPFLEFKRDLRLEVGELVMVCDVLPERLGGGLKAELARISSVVEKPAGLCVIHPEAVRAVGAPVFTAAGDAVGVMGISAAFGREARSYVAGRTSATFMPASLFIHLIDNPPAKESKKSWLGISVRQALTPELAEYWDIEDRKGVIVAHAYKGYPAAQAGIKDEDIIVEFAREPVEVSSSLQIDTFTNRVTGIAPGTKVPVTVLRREQGEFAQHVLEVTLEEAPKDRYHAEKFSDDQFGITVREITFDSADDPEEPESFVGVIVDQVEPGGWAGLAGVRPGDRALKIGEDRVQGIDDFKRLLELARKAEKKEVLLFVRRAVTTHYIRIETHWE